ncbi:MAG: hypothetical protein ABIP65_07455 [Vicinamibacterales bacterium]
MTAFLLAISVAVSASHSAVSLQARQHHAALNERGKQFMGFDQNATAHHFILTRAGGRIEVSVRAADDTKSAGEIRAHLGHLARLFTSGDFSGPAVVHDQKVPGVEKMKAAGAALTYTFEETERGGRLHIVGSTPGAIRAVHEFLKFQITDHRTGDPLVVK